MNQKQKEYAEMRVRQIANVKEREIQNRFPSLDKPEVPNVPTLTLAQVFAKIESGELKLKAPKVSSREQSNRASSHYRHEGFRQGYPCDLDSSLASFLPEGFAVTEAGRKAWAEYDKQIAAFEQAQQERAIACQTSLDKLRAEVTRILDQLHLGDAELALTALVAFEGKTF